MTKKSLLLTCGVVLLASGVAWAQTPATASVQDDKPGTFVFQLGDGGNFLGVQLEPVTKENAGRYQLSGEPRGAGVAAVTADGPAAKAGLQKNDVILRFDGEPVTSVAKLRRLIGESAPQHTARLTVSRNGVEQELSVTLGKRESLLGGRRNAEGFVLKPGEELRGFDTEEWRKRSEELGRQFEMLPHVEGGGGFPNIFFGGGRRLGVSTTPLTAQLADYFGISGKSGVLVTSVSENSPAAKAGLKAGDVITEVDGTNIDDTSDLSRQINRQQEGDVTLTMVRDKRARQLKVTPEKREMPKFEGPKIRMVAPVAALAPRSRVNGFRTVTPALRALPRLKAAPRLSPLRLPSPIL
ncbi:MAG: PDZ domain-containing protein [Pyrinomonadaceae bacterium]